MRLRIVSGGLLVLAAVLFGAVERPASVASQPTLEERARLQSRSDEQQAELAEIEARWEPSSRPAVSAEEAIAGLRRDVIHALALSDLQGVQLDVREGRAPAAVSVGLQARGTASATLSLIETLAVEDRVVLDSVRLSPTRSGAVQLDVQGFRLGGAP